MDIDIIDYTNEHKDAVHALFLEIYPQRPHIADRMRYGVETVGHITTKLAFIGTRIVGQAGIFFQEGSCGVAGMGYHVHPEFRRRGIGARLAGAALADAESDGITKVAVQVSRANTGSVTLARKLGFREPPHAVVGAGDELVLVKELGGRTSTCSRRRGRRG